jgi:hypothetical protein
MSDTNPAAGERFLREIEGIETTPEGRQRVRRLWEVWQGESPHVYVGTVATLANAELLCHGHLRIKQLEATMNEFANRDCNCDVTTSKGYKCVRCKARTALAETGAGE